MLQRRPVPDLTQIYHKERNDARSRKLCDKAVYGERLVRREGTGIAAVGKEVEAGRQHEEHQAAESILLGNKKWIEEHPEKTNRCRKDKEECVNHIG